MKYILIEVKETEKECRCNHCVMRLRCEMQEYDCPLYPLLQNEEKAQKSFIRCIKYLNEEQL